MPDLRDLISEIPDFPKPGILFRDLLPILADPAAVRQTVDDLAAFARPLAPDVVVGAEARGFLFGPLLALELGVGFAPVRKPGKLPGPAHAEAYALEYGEGTLELAVDAIRPGQRALIFDDLLATGGTAAASVALVRRAGAEPVGACFVAELRGLDGRSRLADLPVLSLVEYEGA
jgi:adenine phosphoribosyltransferase